jgi:antirestriction protein ArdC
MNNHDKVKCALNSILDSFETGQIPDALPLALFPTFDIPMSKWSVTNRFLAVLTGTEDARGFRQWQKVGRNVKKGSKSFSILAPRMKKITKDDEDDENVTHKLMGFVGVPVFRVEDSEGDKLDYESIELPEFPLLEVARVWGVRTKSVSSGNGFYGAFAPSRMEIHLASPEELIFFHELAHAAHNKFKPLKGGQHWNQEIVAELSSVCLCRMVGRQPENLGHSHRYISEYAKKADLSAVQGCLKVISDVERVVNLIIDVGRKATKNIY